MGPATVQKDPSLLQFYLNGNVQEILTDSVVRPKHYSAEQHELIGALHQKKPLPPGKTQRDVDELVMQFTEKTEQREKREKILQKAQKKLAPIPEEDSRPPHFFESQGFPKSIKII